ncbi:ATP-binding cassette, subfamily B [Faecalicatena contorta]|uniref:ATP-binding cassette, subfamily B n=2 Tax=Faecalicatena contorta TaxID=39482 RepID=A0A316A3V2_9FIRM|nr:ABC transporter ATP-binding protein [Faecalicatena contorta]PWJ51464.1 ATP-binding cassette subfamily B protein [Faecalicatena contorta]SUQ13020.1 ATP-binding cassette, subfamily B [Faecalicatena contorta]
MNKKQQQLDVQTLKRLLSYLKQYKTRFLFVLLCIFISAGTGVLASLFLQVLIDDYITPLLVQAVPDFSGLLRVIIILGGVYIIGVLATLFYNRMMAVISQRILKDIRDEMFSHMQTLPVKYFDTHSHGDVMSHYTNDTDTLRQMMSQSVPQLFSSVITVVAVLFAMLSISLWLTLFVLVFVVIILQVVKRIAGNSGIYFIRQQESIGDVNGYIEEMINGQKVVKVFCHEEKAKEMFNEKNEKLFREAAQANTYANILMPVMNNLGYVLYVLIAVAGGILGIVKVTNISFTGVNVITLGMIASFLQLSRGFIQPLGQVSQQLSAIVMALAGAKRILQLIDEESETDDGYVTLVNAEYKDNVLTEAPERTGMWAWKHPHEDGTLTYTELKGEVRIYDVDFGYEENKVVLHNITLYAKPGQKVAFVGATGAGKTTITNLLNRFYDIADGKIRYDGININKIKKEDLRRSIGMVLQDVNLFTGTVMENLRYGKLDAADEECIAAARRANADGFIRMLPEGYDTVLSGDGSGLSQGQRQLISIARAAVADPPVMILDEATSSIDTRTETIVQRGMDALMKGRTVFVIAHRLSTVRNSDVIMVLELGQIIERGSHEELIEKQGRYYQLYTGAFELS